MLEINPKTIPDNTPMRFRKVRIAWSVAWGILAVSLIVLWVRSYWYMESIVVPISNTHSFGLFWASGRVAPEIEVGYSHLQRRTSVLTPADAGRWIQLARFGFAFGKNERGPFVIFPFWLAALSSIALGAAPWTKWSRRFTLRTLLIATTLIAVLLGLVVWSIR